MNSILAFNALIFSLSLFWSNCPQVKSYESLSSMSSEHVKPLPGTEPEHFYDSVPIENIESDYIYIQHESTKAIKNDPVKEDSSPSFTERLQHQISSSAESDSPSRNSNYINIDYFLQ